MDNLKLLLEEKSFRRFLICLANRFEGFDFLKGVSYNYDGDLKELKPLLMIQNEIATKYPRGIGLLREEMEEMKGEVHD